MISMGIEGRGMKDELRPCLYAAIASLPNWMFVLTGAQAGPFSAFLLNHIAISQTCVPGATELGKITSTIVRVVFPSNFHSAGSLGGASPTKLKTAAPATP